MCPGDFFLITESNEFLVCVTAIADDAAHHLYSHFQCA